MFTFAQFIGRDNSGEYYSTEVLPCADHYALYQQTQCGFGGEYPTRDEAVAAAAEWRREMQDGPYAAR